MRYRHALIIAALGAAFLMDGNAYAADSDGDGWQDAYETTIGTDPNLFCGSNGWPVDFNSDGQITGSDLQAVASVMGSNVPPAPARRDIAPLDTGPDQQITGNDLAMVSYRIGQTCANVFFIDDVNGDDNLNGKTPANAWQSFDHVNDVSAAGRTFNLIRGGVWSQALTPPTPSFTFFDAYGDLSDPLPKIDTDQAANCLTLDRPSGTANPISVSNLHFEDCLYYGIEITGTGIRAVNISGSEFTLNIGGIHMDASLHIAQSVVTVTDSEFIDNNRMFDDQCGGDPDSGAWGILQNGGKLRAESSFFSGHDAESCEFTRDGAAIEPYQCDSAVTLVTDVVKVVAENNDAFIETPSCGSSTYNIRAEENHIYGDGGRMTSFNFQHGAGSSINIQRNTIQFSNLDSDRYGVLCEDACFLFSNNIVHVVGGHSFHRSAGTVSYNIFKPASECPSSPCGTTNQENVDPLNVSMTDRHLESNSPAIEAGDPNYSPLMVTSDQDGDERPLGTDQEIGADEVVE